MDPTLALRLATLPRLDRKNARIAENSCKLCGRAASFFDMADFNKCGSSGYSFGPSGLAVVYHRCSSCGFIFTTFCDDWTERDFAHYIYNDDYWLVDVEHRSTRPTRIAQQMQRTLAAFKDCRILDYGAGEGLFVSLMRDAGFQNILGYDPFLMPKRPEGEFDIVTCFEVLEHSPWPIKTISEIRSFLADDGCILISQALQPPDIEQIRCNWWYCAPRNGHVSLFASRTMSSLAERAGLIFHRGGMPHVFRTPNARFVELARSLAPEFRAVTLYAPEGEDASWHRPERQDECRFRWCASETLHWRLPPGMSDGRVVQIRIPFLMQIRPKFAEDCKVLIEGRPAATTISDSAIFAEAQNLPAEGTEVVLSTPAPIIPAEAGKSADRRKLGMAIPMAL